ncbi:MAG: cytochrome c [Myxococcales bacterium]|jgi:mono/diheme cytochrome c family protein|nr:cytochrome c [Myxococcales bacterium]
MASLMAALAAATALATGGCGGKYIRAVTAERFEVTPARLVRGGYLVNQVCACGACHTTRAHGNIASEPERTDAFLGGGNLVAAGGVSDGIWVPNVTPDVETGVGGWSDDELARAIRDGVARDGHFLLPFMPFDAYRHLSEEDVRSIVVYLRAVPAFKQPKARTENQLSLIPRLLFTKVGVQMHEPARDVPPPDPNDQAKLGEYIATIAACASCHSLTKKGPRAPEDPQYLSGSEGPFEDPSFGKVWARNLTPDKETGIGRFFPDKIKETIRTGVRFDGKRMAPPMSVMVPHYSGIAEDDLDALVVYLKKTVKPARHQVPPRELVPGVKAVYGEGP